MLSPIRNGCRSWPKRSIRIPPRECAPRESGSFDETFFLYCEDTDLGLRAHWAGWKCIYAAGAIVDHMYSHSAGRASPMKAYLVERNRLYTIVKNFPLRLLWKAPWMTAARYFWHLLSMMGG